MSETSKNKENKIIDFVIIGAGPAALTASIYSAREGVETVLFEKGAVGGLAAVTDVIDNYPGFPDGVSGLKLAKDLRSQAERFGAKIKYGEIKNIAKQDDLFVLSDDMNKKIFAKTVLIATGSDYKKLNVSGESEFHSRGVHYCATCDGPIYKDKKIIVIGGGNSAVQEALFLTKFASSIEVLVRSEFRSSEVLTKELLNNPKIKVHTNVTINKIIHEDNHITGVDINNKLTGEDSQILADGIFVFIGLSPNTKFLQGTDIYLDEIGLIKTNLNLETSVEGIFAAGDVRSGATMQIASAVGEGAKVALAVREFLNK